MKKWLKPIGVGLLALILTTLFLLPDKNLDKYLEMMERELYHDVSRNLERELRRHPAWHEARILLVASELMLGRMDSVLLNMTVLQEAGEEISECEEGVKLWLQYLELPEEQVVPSIAAARRGVERCPGWFWVQSVFLDLAVKYGNSEDVIAALEMLLHLDFSEFSSIESALARIISAGSIDTAWALAEKLEGHPSFGGYMSCREFVVSHVEEAAIISLFEQHPQEPLLAVRYACFLKPDAGLTFLRQWEQKNKVYDIAASDYYRMKLELVHNADSVVFSDLYYLDSQALINVALASQPEKCNLILDFLQERGFEDLVQEARQVLAGPKPNLHLPYTFVSISPDGEKLISSKLAKGKQNSSVFLLAGIEGDEIELCNPDSSVADVFWSPDSSNFVFQFHGDCFIYTAQGELREHTAAESDQIVVGWQSRNSLWLRTRGKALDNLRVYKIDTGETLSSGVTFYNMICVGPKGELAWSSANKTSMQKDGDLLELPFSSETVSWLPDGSGILLERYGMLYLWTGYELHDIIVTGKFLGWRTDTAFYWTSKDDESDASSLMAFNLKTGENTDFKLFGAWVGAAGETAISSFSSQSGFFVYRLP